MAQLGTVGSNSQAPQSDSHETNPRVATHITETAWADYCHFEPGNPLQNVVAE